MLDRQAIDQCRDQILPLLDVKALASHWRCAIKTLCSYRSASRELGHTAQLYLIYEEPLSGASVLESMSRSALCGSKGEQSDFDLSYELTGYYRSNPSTQRPWWHFRFARHRGAMLIRAVASLSAMAYLEMYYADCVELHIDVRTDVMSLFYVHHPSNGLDHDLAVAYPLFYLARALSGDLAGDLPSDLIGKEADFNFVMSLVFATAGAREASVQNRILEENIGVCVSWNRLEETLGELLCRFVIPHITFKSIVEYADTSVDSWAAVASMGRLPPGQITSWICA